MARSGGLEDTGPRSEAEIVEIDEGRHTGSRPALNLLAGGCCLAEFWRGRAFLARGGHHQRGTSTLSPSAVALRVSHRMFHVEHT